MVPDTKEAAPRVGLTSVTAFICAVWFLLTGWIWGSLAFHLTWEILLFGASAVMLCCIIAGLVSLLRVFRLEPGIVFKA